MLEIIQTVVIIAIGILVVIVEIPKIKIKNSKQKVALLDSCALIDGRIVELVKTGFAPDHLVVPEFIVSELQLLADGNDSHKRERARFGLEVVQQLQQEPGISLDIDHTKINVKKYLINL